MADREKVIEGLKKVWDAFNSMEHELYADYVFDALAMLNEQEAKISRISNEYLALVGKASKKPTVVRCKDCIHRGDKHKCILAFIADKQDFPYFFYDNRGEWFCADRERRET